MSRDRGDRCPPGPRLVYSTGPGPLPAQSTCAACGRSPCACAPRGSVEPASHPVLQVRRERAGRRGKTVTTIATLAVSREDAADLLRRLKKRLGCGGRLVPSPGEAGAGFALELQGDRVERAVGELERQGYRARRAGG